MENKECECVTKWKNKIKKEFNAESISVEPFWNMGKISYRKIVIPKNIYKRDYNEPRISKYWFHAESKDFKFCPYCGKKLKEEKKNK